MVAIINLYEVLKQRVLALGANLTVTHYALTLGAEHPNTGIPAKQFSSGTPIDMIIISKASQQMLTGTGIFIKSDYMGFTPTRVDEGDEVKAPNNQVYIVIAVRPNPIGNIMAFYTVDLVEKFGSEGIRGNIGWDCAVINNPGGSVNPYGIVHVNTGNSLTVTATSGSDSNFVGWIFDDIDVGTANPYTVAAQADGTTHVLICDFEKIESEYMRIRPNIQYKLQNTPTTEYLKSECIQADGTVVAAPTGKVVSYEAGYLCLALMKKAEAGYSVLVQKILDAYVLLQNLDGSWYQQYDPTINASGTHDRAAMVDATHTGDLKVDSGCATLINAMSLWDQINSQTRYKTVVQLGLSWLHTLSYDHQVAHGNNMLANLIYQGQVDTMAFSADTAECLLAMQSALNAYGDTLTGSDDYSTKTFANGVFYGLVAYAYRGNTYRAYETTDPIGTQCLIPFDYKENISYAQALTALAVKLWSIDANNTAGDFSGQAETVLDQAGALTNGQWGGQLYVPYYGNADENQDEYTVYTSFMLLAMKTVNPTEYAGRIMQYLEFIKSLCTPQGQVYDLCDKTGDLYICKLNAPQDQLVEGYGFITLTAATALYAYFA